MIYFWFILGTIVGSFLNVCIHRLPRGESIVFPSSHCPACEKKLSLLDLIPILGYFLLGGKCRCCRVKISPRYPLVEFLAAAGFALSWMQAGGNMLDFVFQIIFVSVLLVLFFSDLEQQVIPDSVSFFGIAVGLIYNFLRGPSFFLSAFSGMLIGFCLLYLIGKLGKLWFKKEAMGEGDFYAAAILGAGLGWQGGLLSILLAFLLAGFVSVFLIISGRVKMGQYIPFGPALAAGGIIALFFGGRIIEWYL